VRFGWVGSRITDRKAENDLPAVAREGEGWSRRWDSNPQPPVYKTGALPLSYAGEALLRNRTKVTGKKQKMVAPRGLEPRTN
jgi:hypothetical protein